MYRVAKAGTFEELERLIDRINKQGDTLITVTQGTHFYTIIYQTRTTNTAQPELRRKYKCDQRVFGVKEFNCN